MQLNLPDQRAIPGVDTRPAPLRDWLSALPFVNTESTAASVIERLHDINHQRIPAAQRLELLAAFRHSYDRLHEPLRAVGRKIDPLTQPRALSLLTDLTEQMSYGYKYALRDVLDDRQRWGRSKQLAEAANYCAHFVALLLLCRYQSYQPVSDQSWREIGDLVRFAETKTLAPTRDTHCLYSLGQTQVLTTYSQLALLRLGDPYRLAPGLIWEAYGYLAGKIGTTELLREFDGELSPGLYGLSLDHEPQQSRPAPTSGVERTAWRCLDARELVSEARHDMERLANGTHPHRLGFSNQLSNTEATQLLGRLLGQWTRSSQRKSPRFSSSVTVELSPGLDAAYYFLNNLTTFNPADFAPAENEDEIDFSVTGLRRGATSEQDFRLVSCPTRNRSSGGLALRIGTLEGLSLRVGSLMLIGTPGNQGETKRDWLIGVVRWLVSHDGSTELGVQYVARDCVACVLTPTSGAIRHSQPALQNELILANGHRLQVLIAPKGIYSERTILEVNRGGTIVQVRCTQLIETGSGFERFCFEPLE